MTSKLSGGHTDMGSKLQICGAEAAGVYRTGS